MAATAPNHLRQRSVPKRLNEVWITDITYLPTREGRLYLAAEMDLCSRRIIGWSTRANLTTELPLAALERALQTRGSNHRGLLHHSDRGCQYTSTDFRKSLRLRGITASMSRTANCYNNATMESFWATLKAECFGSIIPATRAQARAMVFDYIETFYNPVRLHSALGLQSLWPSNKPTKTTNPTFRVHVFEERSPSGFLVTDRTRWQSGAEAPLSEGAARGRGWAFVLRAKPALRAMV
jgi:transposase InsO family protein